jgi:hypothetical protein
MLAFGFAGFVFASAPLVLFAVALLLYANRVALYWYTYFERGYVYPADEETPSTSTSCAWKFFFPFFPAAFVQVLTDFPFNGDLATKRPLFRFFQAVSWAERAVALVICELYTPTLQPSPLPVLLFIRVQYAVALAASLVLSAIYFSVKAPKAAIKAPTADGWAGKASSVPETWSQRPSQLQHQNVVLKAKMSSRTSTVNVPKSSRRDSAERESGMIDLEVSSTTTGSVLRTTTGSTGSGPRTRDRRFSPSPPNPGSKNRRFSPSPPSPSQTIEVAPKSLRRASDDIGLRSI